MKGLNLRELREAIDGISAQLAKLASSEDLKRLETLVMSFSSKIDKNTSDIKQLFGFFTDLQKSISKLNPTDAVGTAELKALTLRV